jgi:hypothetical protein
VNFLQHQFHKVLCLRVFIALAFICLHFVYSIVPTCFRKQWRNNYSANNYIFLISAYACNSHETQKFYSEKYCCIRWSQ